MKLCHLSNNTSEQGFSFIIHISHFVLVVVVVHLSVNTMMVHNEFVADSDLREQTCAYPILAGSNRGSTMTHQVHILGKELVLSSSAAEPSSRGLEADNASTAASAPSNGRDHGGESQVIHGG